MINTKLLSKIAMEINYSLLSGALRLNFQDPAWKVKVAINRPLEYLLDLSRALRVTRRSLTRVADEGELYTMIMMQLVDSNMCGTKLGDGRQVLHLGCLIQMMRQAIESKGQRYWSNPH
jgi:hypothetical protein